MTQPPRTREQIAAEIEQERQALAGAVGALRKSGGEVAAKAKRMAPLAGLIVAVGGFFATKAFLGTLRLIWRRFRG